MWHQHFSEIVKREFEKIQSSQKISLRSFARHLNEPPGMISEILSQKRIISYQSAVRVLKKLQVQPDELTIMRDLYDRSLQTSPPTVLSSEAVEMILNPVYYQVMCALEILPNPTTQAAIRSYLDLPSNVLPSMIDSLEKFEIISTKNGQIEWSGRHVTTAENITSKKIQEFHRQTLANAAVDLKLPIEEREYTAVTFAGSVSQLEHAKKQIRDFRMGLCESMRGSKLDRIYQISVQLRPVSKVYKEDPS